MPGSRTRRNDIPDLMAPSDLRATRFYRSGQELAVVSVPFPDLLLPATFSKAEDVISGA